MEFGALLDDAFSYTKEGILCNISRWAALILAVICLGIPMNGYAMRIYRGTDTAPDVDRWGTLFIDGIKLVIVGLVYSIPILVVWAFIYGSMILTLGQGNLEAAGNFEPNLALLLLMYAVEIAVGIIMPIASIRFARTGSFGEAFNFGAIFGTIGKIGWINYLLALIILTLVIGIPIFILMFGIIIVGGGGIYLVVGGGVELLFAIAGLLILAMLILSPIIGVFQARYMTRVYESQEQAE
ncbi:MAG: hypothetical protein CVV32_08045 [Methanomicrobiales archaeon HGW-Methanomicrobiales-3]|jgi:hypothetical protein|nr:MAG: hypothetical protein CVV32_08045 [Methanomicrobiales archaeon HGW-Methanomicrobiales-3]